MATFFSADAQPSEARDVARILLDTLYDLRDIRSVIRDKNDEVAVILQRTEGTLRAKAQQLTGEFLGWLSESFAFTARLGGFR